VSAERRVDVDDTVVLHRRVSDHGDGWFTVREEYATVDGTFTEVDEFCVSVRVLDTLRAMVGELAGLLDASGEVTS
jgi:hypothetical protein